MTVRWFNQSARYDLLLVSISESSTDLERIQTPSQYIKSDRGTLAGTSLLYLKRGGHGQQQLQLTRKCTVFVPASLTCPSCARAQPARSLV